MSKTPLVSVVIIDFNSEQYIWRCLDALKKQTYQNIEIFVVDNNSDDGSSEKLKKIQDDNFHYKRFDENVGSSAANNYGIRSSKGELVLILNADVFLNEDYIEKSVLAFEKDKSIGTVTGKLLSAHDHNIIDSTGIILYKEGVGDERGIGEIDVGQYEEEEYIVGACCASAMYKREMLERIRYEDEYYDESFFAFVEDLDLSVIATLQGWKTLYFPKAIGYHIRGGSTSSMSDFVKFLNLRNSELFYRKVLSRFAMIRFFHTLLNLIRIITISKDMKNKIRQDLEQYEETIELRKNHLTDLDYKNLKPFVNKSYIWNRLNPFAK